MFVLEKLICIFVSICLWSASLIGDFSCSEIIIMTGAGRGP